MSAAIAMPFNIADYTILREIGRGATSIVYECQKGSETFAMKVMLIKENQDKVRDSINFSKEAAVLSRVNHPSIVRLIEAGQFDGQPFLVMELVRGDDLRGKITAGQFSEGQLIEFLLAVSRGLSYVHRMGLVHRDIKPENILVREKNEFKIIDFGFAKSRDFAAINTEEGAGTIMYTAPEILDGKISDNRCDLYSLGAVAYEILAGRPPFEIKSTQLIGDIKNGNYQNILDINPQADPVLAAIVQKLMAKNPDERYQSAEGLIADLENRKQLTEDLKEGRLLLDQTSHLVKISYEVQFIGRDEEIKTLSQAWAGCRAGCGVVVQVEGEGGCGKSRLTQELLNVCREDGFLLLRGKCQQNDITPMAVLRQCLDDYIFRLSRLSENQRQAAYLSLRTAAGSNAAIIKRVSSGMAKIFSDVPDEAMLDATTERQRLLTAMSQLLLDLSRGPTPLLILIDDSQWIDSLSLEILKMVATNLKACRMMILSTARNDEASIGAATKYFEGLGGEPENRIVLKPLSLDAVDTFAKALLGSRELPKEVVEKLCHITKGNIFALREYILSMINQGMLLPTSVGWHVNMEEFNKLAVDGNVLQLILNRLKYLSEDAVRILGVASIIGMTFDKNLLSRVCNRQLSDVENTIKEASQINLIEISEEQFTFVHDRIREALAETLNEEEAKDIHQSIADSLFQMDSKTPEGIFALAHHYSCGRPSADYSRAFYATYRAGVLALDNFANEQAFDLLSKALKYHDECAEPMVPMDELFEAVGLAHFRLGQMDKAFDYFNKALTETKDSRRIGDVTANICEALDSMGHYDSSEQRKGAFEYLEMGLASLSEPLPKSKILFIFTVLIDWLKAIFIIRTGVGFGSSEGEDRERRKTLSKLYGIGTHMSFRQARVNLMAYYVITNLYNSNLLGASREAAVAGHLYCWFMGVLGLKKAALKAGYRAIAIAEQIGDRPALLLSKTYLGMAMIVLNCTRDYDEASKTVYDDLSKYLPGHRSTAYSPVGHMQHLHLKGASRDLLQFAEDRYPLLEKFGNFNFLLAANITLSMDSRLCGRENLVQEFFNSREKLLAREIPEGIKFVATFMMKAADLFIEYAKGAVEPNTASTLTKEALELKVANFYWREFPLIVAYANRLLLLSTDSNTRREAFKNLEMILRRKKFFLKRTPVHRAHYLVLSAVIEDFLGRPEKSLKTLDLAEADANESESEWARFEILRERARIFRKINNANESQRYAKEALALSDRQGWVLHSAALRAEFNQLEQSHVAELAIEGKKLGANDRELTHYLDSLLRVSLASAATIKPEDQAQAALDELIKVLGADRAFLFRVDEKSELKMHAGRDASGQNLLELKGYSSTVVKIVCKDRRAMMVNGTDEGLLLGSESAVIHNLRSIMAAPMMIQDTLIGAVYIDSKATQVMFTDEDLRFFEAIVNHISIAIKLSFMAEVEAQRRALEKDMALASAVQSFFLPVNRDLISSNFHVATSYEAATHVSGDWWWYEVDEKKGMTVLVGDVTGHGAAPAMLTASVCSQYRLLKRTRPDDSLFNLMNNLNDEFTLISGGDYMMTMTGIEISNDGRLTLFNAAGPEILLLKPNGEVLPLLTKGSPMGVPDFNVEPLEYDLAPGDRLLIATDGLYEMVLENGNMIRGQQIMGLLRNTVGQSTKLAIDNLENGLKRLRGESAKQDDMSMILVDYKPSSL